MKKIILNPLIAPVLTAFFLIYANIFSHWLYAVTSLEFFGHILKVTGDRPLHGGGALGYFGNALRGVILLGVVHYIIAIKRECIVKHTLLLS